ncbi:nucleotide sugar dehydrogenase [Salisaeta longa]|uniref:nucleotide sugar dehydrogenase n=1 Tax=Salisaeta longa TaxID=503170 RepID=UPI0003B7070C|nr:nucleotide sugar dehydrogenase [Salisaeta longa]
MNSPTHVSTPNGEAPPAGPALSGPAQQLADRLHDKSATIGIIGLGYVGLPLAVEYAAQGFSTIGIDVDEQRVARLNAGDNYIEDLDDDHVRSLVDQETLQGTTSFEACADVDVFYICVPTPVTPQKEPDTTYIESAAQSIADHLRPGQLVILKSTTYPNTTEGVVQPILDREGRDHGWTLGEDYFLAFSPERIDPGNKEYTTANTPVVAGGVTPVCTELTRRALDAIVGEVHTVANPKVAEMEKLLENIFRSVNIALVNELARLCDRMGGVSMWEVVEAAATKPFGFMPFYPGPGLGGHCIPIDPHYLAWIAKRYDFETSFITLAARINEGMPFYVTEAVVEAIAKQPIALSDARVLILGVAFKGNVDDTRHSPAETVIKQLRAKGIDTIHFADPHVDGFTVPQPDGTRRTIEKVDCTPEVLANHDVAVIITDHAAFDAALIADHAPAIVDTRNLLADVDDDALQAKMTLLGGG